MLSILSHEKNFADRWVGHRALNERGLHVTRMRLAEAAAGFRRLCLRTIARRLEDAATSLARDGYCALEDFLSDAAFKRLADACRRTVDRHAPAFEGHVNDKPGFSDLFTFEGGRYRFDGGTLNVFFEISETATPEAAEFARDERLSALSAAVVGMRHDPRKTEIYLTIHGSEDKNPDIQKVMHRDTFFSAMKFWFFLEDVRPEDGPFMFVPRSHLLDSRRLQWENEVALGNVRDPTKFNRGGSFRIEEAALPMLGLPQPIAFTCPANTLVVANTFGFHRRGQAQPGARRLAIYGWHRPGPFGLIAH